MDKNIKEQWERIKEAVMVSHVESTALHELVEFVEDTFIDPIYCPKCGSCGDTGCHPNPAICVYVDTHQEDFDNILKQNGIMFKALEELEDLADNWQDELDGATQELKLGFVLGRMISRIALALGDADDVGL